MSRTCRSLLFLVLVCFLSSAGASERLGSFQTSIKLLSTALILVVLEQVLHEDPTRLRWILGAVAISLALPAVLGILQLVGVMHLTVDPYDPVPLDRIRGRSSTRMRLRVHPR